MRHRPQAASASALHCFVLDCSASMRSSGALARAKGLLSALMAEAYRRRERVALVCFGAGQAEVRLAPRRASAWNEAWLLPIGGGGGTPLGLGIVTAEALLRRTPATLRTLWLLTDGRSRELPPAPRAAQQLWLVDCESTPYPLGRLQGLAGQWEAGYLRLDDVMAR